MVTPVKVEIEHLIKVKFIQTIRYIMRVSNIIPVIKKNDKLRVCIDFRNLHNTTFKDEYPIVVVDMLIDSIVGNAILSFMDRHFSYNQFFTTKDNVSKTTFRL